jgi:hypothetical protein
LFSKLFDLEFCAKKCIQIGCNNNNLYLNNEVIPKKVTAKYLGVNLTGAGLDQSTLKAQAAQCKSMILKYSKVLDDNNNNNNDKISLYRRVSVIKSFIRPHLEYANQLHALFNHNNNSSNFYLYGEAYKKILKIPSNNINHHICTILLGLPAPHVRIASLELSFYVKGSKEINCPDNNTNLNISNLFSQEIIRQKTEIIYPYFKDLINDPRVKTNNIKKLITLSTLYYSLDHLRSHPLFPEFLKVCNTWDNIYAFRRKLDNLTEEEEGTVMALINNIKNTATLDHFRSMVSTTI